MQNKVGTRKQKAPISLARRALIAKVHIAKKDMGLSDDVYRDMVEFVADGKRSCTQLDNHQLARLVEHFKDRGWTGDKTPKRKPGRNYRTPSKRPMIRKIYVLWGILHKAERVKEKRPDGFVRRMTKTEARPDGVGNVEWLEDGDAFAVIEALKKWIRREDLDGELK